MKNADTTGPAASAGQPHRRGETGPIPDGRAVGVGGEDIEILPDTPTAGAALRLLITDRVNIVVVTVMIVLILQRYVDFTAGFEEDSRGWWVMWGLGRLAAYTVLPVLVMRFVLRDPIAERMLRRPGAKELLIGVVMLAVMLPVVFVVSNLSSFQAKYPYHVPSTGLGEMWVWWIAYGLQFFGLEFFFRGFMVHSLKPDFGAHRAVLVMCVPYLMIHFGKPVLESVGAIIAGLVLGHLSLRYRSIWLGVLAHIGVAVTMDALSLWRQDLL